MSRFIPISQREERCDISKSVWRTITENYLQQTWKGIQIEKGPMQLAVYPMLVSELKPQTIIELGALKGGSAVWLADHLELFGISGKVYSVDINLSNLDEKAKAYSRINFIEGDCYQLGKTLPPSLMLQLPHPWLIIEDVHTDVVQVMEHFNSNGIETGDYIIIEDTNKIFWEAWSDWDDEELFLRGIRKHGDLKQWLLNHPDEYLVDTLYLDLFGYNCSKNWNSILKKV